ncbi:MAG: septum formation initiator family protein [Elusimicrobia bacterium]|nr:septum formation initiator family protein [Elusimicrobiota bacterium]MBU2614942.1 septum formation initiator family protein [Elusimicrobiota bacterium]
MNFRAIFSKKNRKILIAVIIAAVLIFNRGFFNLVKRNIEVYKIKKEVVKLQLENARLRKEIYLLDSNEAYIDYRIRRGLGYIKEGEIEYRFPTNKKK